MAEVEDKDGEFVVRDVGCDQDEAVSGGEAEGNCWDGGVEIVGRGV